MGEREIERVVSSFRGLTCTDAARSAGTMIRLEFGVLHSQKGRGGGEYSVGDATIWVEADDWVLSSKGAEVAASEGDDSQWGYLIEELFLATTFEPVRVTGRGIVLSFAGDVEISAWCDEAKGACANDDLVVFHSPGGAVLSYSPGRELFDTGERDPARAQ